MMTDLQASLMMIGGTIVIGVISYNKWQEYKARKTVEKVFSSEHDDVLMASDDASLHSPHVERQEPSLVDVTASVPTPTITTGEFPQEEHILPSERAIDSVLAYPAQKELPVDEMIDCLLSLAIDAPVRGEKVLAKIQTLRHIGNKPVHFIGQCDDGTWESVAHGGIYHALKAGVQLANRENALNEIEYSELIMRLRQVADEMDAEPEVPDMTDVMVSAKQLYQFVNEYDAQLSVNIQSNGAPWAISTLMAALERQGFDLRPDGQLVMPDGDGGILFSLTTNVTLASETTSRLTLLLDVPRVAPLRDGFGAMVACARVLSGRLGGTVVDDGNQPLSASALEEIAGQVNSFYEHMEAATIPAGSSRALRLFS